MIVHQSSISSDRNSEISDVSGLEIRNIDIINDSSTPLHTPIISNKFLLTDNDLLNHYYENSSLHIPHSDIPILTISTLNVNGLNNSHLQECFIQSFSYLKSDILGLTDTKLPSKRAAYSINSLPGYRSIWNPKSHTSHSGGVGLLLKHNVFKFL